MVTTRGRLRVKKSYAVSCAICGGGTEVSESGHGITYNVARTRLRGLGWREQTDNTWRCSDCVDRPERLARLWVTPRGIALFRQRVSDASAEAILVLAKESRAVNDEEWELIAPRKWCSSRWTIRVNGSVAFLVVGNEVRSAWRFR